MEKKQIITLGGKPGSGKSTTCKLLAQELDYKHFSSGDLFREIAKERGVDVYEINVLAETEREIDLEVDNRLKEIGSSEDKLVIDSRMAWHWMPYSFKVYLDLDLETAAKRIMAKLTPERIAAEHIPDTPVEYAEVLQKRLDSESKRYMNLYQQNPYDTSNYDLVIDTNENSPEQVKEIILARFKEWTD